MGLEARIWASRLGFGPQVWDLGLETGIWASGLGFEGEGQRRRRRRRRRKKRGKRRRRDGRVERRLEC